MQRQPDSFMLPQEVLTEVAELPTDAARKNYLSSHPRLADIKTANALLDEIRKSSRVNPRHSLALACFAVALAQRLRDQPLLAQAQLAQANSFYLAGENRSALASNARALALFRKLKLNSDVARALNSSIQPSILLGRYDQALAAAEEARQIFTAEGNPWRLARVELNTGNIFHRQDRFAEALACYERAEQYFSAHEEQDPEAVAVLLHNEAVCLISLDDFPRALSCYQKARAFSERHNMPALVAQADYNIAWLYFLRGDYILAISLLRAAREACRKNQDHYHFALCHMDLSEIYLELNLPEEAEEMAQEGVRLFEPLAQGYETAKCLANLAIAHGQQGKTFRALESFARAREMFVSEKNSVWPSLIDLYKALLLFNEGRLFEARRFCQAALDFFRDSALAGKAILCHLLMARLSLRQGEHAAAIRECRAALARLGSLELPSLRYQAHFLLGEIQSAQAAQEAYNSYQQARDDLENLRGALHSEELKIAFMKDKLAVYGRLFELCLARETPEATEEAFACIEQAKSRSMLDSMLRPAHSPAAAASTPSQSELVRNMAKLREELNWYYHRIEIEQLRPQAQMPERVAELQAKARRREDEFLSLLRESSLDAAPLQSSFRASLPTLSQTRSQLRSGQVLVEYFRVQDRIYVALLSANSVKIVAVTLAQRISNLLRLLQFQLSKPRLGSAYTESFAADFLEAVRHHLHELYNELLAPVRDQLQAEHLIVVPHDLLHQVPFAALHDGNQYLLDSFAISYAPSAALFAFCQSRTQLEAGAPLLLGVSDAAAPHVATEIESLAKLIPQAKVFTGAEATASTLEANAQSRFIHIASHGAFDEEHPMFSGIRLGESRLTAHDIGRLKLSAELVTLSGCATGMNVVAAGDELLGMVRSLFSAGAQSVLLTLWDVHDRSTADFMPLFYRGLMAGEPKAAALRGAMLELRRRYPHPYHWAPFTLVGKA